MICEGKKRRQKAREGFSAAALRCLELVIFQQVRGKLRPGGLNYPTVRPFLSDREFQWRDEAPRNERTAMRRQFYYPVRNAARVVWLTNYAHKVGAHAAALGLDAAGTIADAQWLIYVLGTMQESLRSFSSAATQYGYLVQNGRANGSAFAAPVFVMPAPPSGVSAVEAGALGRIFKFVRKVKNAAGYTPAMGEDLGIIGTAAANGDAAPTVWVELVQGENGKGVQVHFLKHGHKGVIIESRRGAEENFSFLANDTSRPFVDERPLLVPGQPEVREYRLRFWDQGEANGAWSPVLKITVSE
jgi:hypothetical protein